ncbi:MAG TPA: response regulator [Azospirillaceae bacterium]|nr:response regulator [Azospirillaceae bacterium]
MSDRPRILIVEDEALVAMASAEALETGGCDVTGIAASHEEALAAAAAVPPHLVVMDIRLKGAVDGIETARELKRRHDCRIVFCTGQGDRTTRERAEGIGAAAYLKKPFTPAQLVQAVTAALA